MDVAIIQLWAIVNVGHLWETFSLYFYMRRVMRSPKHNWWYLLLEIVVGQFLYRDNTNGQIYEVGDKNAEAKTRECFRNTIYYHTHKDDTDFIEKRLEYKRNYYHAHKHDLEFKARTAKSRAKYHI